MAARQQHARRSLASLQLPLRGGRGRYPRSEAEGAVGADVLGVSASGLEHTLAELGEVLLGLGLPQAAKEKAAATTLGFDDVLWITMSYSV